MPVNLPGLLPAVAEAVAAARGELDQLARDRTAAVGEQVATAASLSRSKQLPAELAAVATSALRYQRARASALEEALNERPEMLDAISADLEELAGNSGGGSARQ